MHALEPKYRFILEVRDLFSATITKTEIEVVEKIIAELAGALKVSTAGTNSREQRVAYVEMGVVVKGAEELLTRPGDCKITRGSALRLFRRRSLLSQM